MTAAMSLLAAGVLEVTPLAIAVLSARRMLRSRSAKFWAYVLVFGLAAAAALLNLAGGPSDPTTPAAGALSAAALLSWIALREAAPLPPRDRTEPRIAAVFHTVRRPRPGGGAMR